jgi:simple sugar transport system substrate-binding protein
MSKNAVLSGVHAALVACVALVSGICGSPPVLAQSSDITVIAVTHGQASDPFWSVVKNGISKAGEDYGITVQYRAPETFDMVRMAQLIEAAVNQEPDGLVVSNPDPDALGAAIRRAVAAGIPVISVNSGSDAADSLGIALHVGQDELEAGRIAGARFSEFGMKNVLCVNHEVGNVSLDRRCDGVAEGLTTGNVRVLPTTADPTATEAKIRAALSRDDTVDAVIGLSAPLVGEPAVAAVQTLGLEDSIMVATFDMSAGFLQAVADGKAAFAVDQQPFLQGYLPVSFLVQHARYGLIPASNVQSGPSFVTRETAPRVIELAAKGIR